MDNTTYFNCAEFSSNELSISVEEEKEQIVIQHIGWGGSSTRWLSFDDAKYLARIINEAVNDR